MVLEVIIGIVNMMNKLKQVINPRVTGSNPVGSTR